MLTITIHNAETNEVTEREMTKEELAQYETDLANWQIEKDKFIAEVNAKKALLEKLGITEDEAKLLLS